MCVHLYTTRSYIRGYIVYECFSHAYVPQVYPAGRCRVEERFNVFTPPMKRRIGPGMLIARGTIVGFLRPARRGDSPARLYRTSGIISFYFNPRMCMRATWARIPLLFTTRLSRAYVRYPAVTIDRCRRTYARIDVICSVKLRITPRQLNCLLPHEEHTLISRAIFVNLRIIDC